MSEATTIAAGDLHRFAVAIFEAAGFSTAHAHATADVLVWADLRGHASHGVMRIPSYLGWAAKGIIDPSARPVVTRRRGAVVTLDARRAIGPAALVEAAGIAAEQARETALAWVVVKDHSHAGAIGYYARLIAEAGLMAVVMTGSRPLMAYYGTRDAAVATNPLAVAMPGGFLFDMSSAAIAKGKIAAAAASGKALPRGVACDADGQVTTDPAKAVTILPLGGAKGAGLSLAIEALTSLSLGNPLIASALGDAREAKDVRQNSLVVAVDPEAIEGGGDVAQGVAETAHALKAQPRAQGFDEILMPGERGDREAARRSVGGIRIAAKTWAELAAVASEHGVAMPEGAP